MDSPVRTTSMRHAGSPHRARCRITTHVASYAAGALLFAAGCEQAADAAPSSGVAHHGSAADPTRATAPGSRDAHYQEYLASDESSQELAGSAMGNVPELDVRVVDFHFEGSLCSAGSVRASSTSPAGVRVDFADAELDARSRSAVMTGSCTGYVTLQMPEDYRFGEAFLCLQQYADDSVQPFEAGELGASEWKVGFQGGGLQSIRRSFTVERPDQSDCSRLRVWTPCNTSDLVRLAVSLDATAQPQEYVRLPSFSLSIEPAQGAKWQSCDGTPLPPNGEKAFCGGINDIGCRGGLACYIRDRTREYATGACLAPNERLGQRGEPCWGPDDIKCAEGLDCMARDERSGEGICMSPEDRDCNRGGAAACAAGQMCRPNGNCSLADGTEGSVCTAELPCQPKFVCDPFSQRCKPSLAATGESCGGEDGRSCATRLTCDAALGRCRASRGHYLEYCDEQTNCVAELLCQAHRCWKRNAPRGAECSVDNECASGDCSKSACL